jgi:hypothetical protein
LLIYCCIDMRKFVFFLVGLLLIICAILYYKYTSINKIVIHYDSLILIIMFYPIILLQTLNLIIFKIDWIVETYNKNKNRFLFLIIMIFIPLFLFYILLITAIIFNFVIPIYYHFFILLISILAMSLIQSKNKSK